MNRLFPSRSARFAGANSTSAAIPVLCLYFTHISSVNLPSPAIYLPRATGPLSSLAMAFL